MAKAIIVTTTITQEQFDEILINVSNNEARRIIGTMRRKLDKETKDKLPIEELDLSDRVLQY